jgi:hypothetical protein
MGAVTKRGIDLGSNVSGWAPLWRTARNGQVEVVKLLVEKEGVDPASDDNYSQTPI